MKVSRLLAAIVVAAGLVGITATSAQATLSANTSIPVDGGSSIVYSPSGDRVYSTSYGGKTVSSIDAATQTLIRTSAVLTGSARSIAVSPDGSKIYVVLGSALSTANMVVAMDSATLTVQSTITVGPNAQEIAITPNGQTLFVTNFAVTNNVSVNDNSVSVIDVATESVSYLRSTGTGTTYSFSKPSQMAVSSDGLYLYVENQGTEDLMKIRISDFSVIWTTTTGTIVAPFGMALSPDGSSLYVGSRDATSTTTSFIDSIDTATGARYTNGRISSPTGTAPSGNSNGLYDMSVSGDGTMLYVVGNGTAGFLEYSIGINHLPTYSHTYSMTSAMRIAASPVDSTFYGGVVGTIYPFGPTIGRSTQEFTRVVGDSITSLGFTPTGLTGSVTYSISPGLPSGMSFNTSTGVISGTPTSALTKTLFTVTATDGTSKAAGFVSITVTSPSGGSNNAGGNNNVSSGGTSALANTGISSSLFLASGALGLSLMILGGVMVFARRMSFSK